MRYRCNFLFGNLEINDDYINVPPPGWWDATKTYNLSPTRTIKIKRKCSHDQINNIRSFRLAIQYNKYTTGVTQMLNHEYVEPKLYKEPLKAPFKNYHMKKSYAYQLQQLTEQAFTLNYKLHPRESIRTAPLTCGTPWRDLDYYDDDYVARFIKNLKTAIKNSEDVLRERIRKAKRKAYLKDYNFFKDLFEKKPAIKEPSAPPHQIANSNSRMFSPGRTITLRRQQPNGNITNINFIFNFNIGRATCGIL